MKRPRSHEIDREGKSIFTSLLPPHWEPREETPDYGIDYVVEVFAKGRSTGLRFGVQLKSTTSLKTTVEAVHVPFRTNNLADYVDKQRLPVFLVVVDIHSRKGFWCFLQGYVDDGKLAPGWRAQKSVTIKIPLDHTLSDTDRLATAVAAADTRMAELRPSAPEAAIRAEKKRLEGLDPRFKIQLSADAKGRHVHLVAKEDVEVNISFTAPPEELREKMANLIDKGLPVDFLPGQVQFDGSKLFEDGLGDRATIHIAQSHPAVLRLRPHREHQPVADWMEYPGRFMGGRKEYRFINDRTNVPLLLDLRIARDGDSAPEVILDNIVFEYPKWSGQSLRRLAFFDQTAELIRCAESGCPWELDCCIEGNRVFHGLISSRQSSPDHISDLIELLTEARRIAESQRVEVLFPEEFRERNAEDIRRITALLSGEEVQYPRAPQSMTLRAAESGFREWLAAYDSKVLHVPVRFGYSSLPFPFFDHELEIGPLDVTVTRMLLEPSVDRLREMAKTSGCKLESLSLRASPDTQTMVSKRRPESVTETSTGT